MHVLNKIDTQPPMLIVNDYKNITVLVSQIWGVSRGEGGSQKPIAVKKFLVVMFLGNEERKLIRLI